MNRTVRRATGDDLSTVVDLVEEYCAADGHGFVRDDVIAGVEPLLADAAVGVVWLIEVDDVPAGYAAVTWGWSIEIGGFEAVLDELFVRTKGRGLGAQLLEFVEADCRMRSVRRIFLETERPNERARALYRRHGYVADDSIWMSKVLC